MFTDKKNPDITAAANFDPGGQPGSLKNAPDVGRAFDQALRSDGSAPAEGQTESEQSGTAASEVDSSLHAASGGLQGQQQSSQDVLNVASAYDRAVADDWCQEQESRLGDSGSNISGQGHPFANNELHEEGSIPRNDELYSGPTDYDRAIADEYEDELNSGQYDANELDYRYEPD